MQKVWMRYNLSISEDLCQLRAGRDLCTTSQNFDCEDSAQHSITVTQAILKLKQDLNTMKTAKLAEFLDPQLHPSDREHENVQFIQSIHHLLGQVKGIRCSCRTGEFCRDFL